MERRGTTPKTSNSPAAYSDKKRQKKNRKGCHTFTVMGDYTSILWIFDIWFEGKRVPCTSEDFFNRLSSLIHDTMYVNARQSRRQSGIGLRPHIKNPSKLQNEVRGNIEHENTAHRTSFFLFGGLYISFKTQIHLFNSKIQLLIGAAN